MKFEKIVSNQEIQSDAKSGISFQATLGDLVPEFFARALDLKNNSQLSSDENSSDTTEVVMKECNKQSQHRGKLCEDGKWRTFKEIDQLRHEARLNAKELEKQVFSIQNVDQNNQLISYKPSMSDFEKENKVVKVIGRFNQHKIYTTH